MLTASGTRLAAFPQRVSKQAGPLLHRAGPEGTVGAKTIRAVGSLFLSRPIHSFVTWTETPPTEPGYTSLASPRSFVDGTFDSLGCWIGCGGAVDCSRGLRQSCPAPTPDCDRSPFARRGVALLYIRLRPTRDSSVRLGQRGAVDHEDLDRATSGFELQTQLLLQRNHHDGGGRVGGFSGACCRAGSRPPVPRPQR